MELGFDIQKLELPNGRTIEQQMKYEANRLVEIIQEEIADWYKDYTPSTYLRTYQMYNSVYSDDFVEVEVKSGGTRLSISVKYTDEAFHKSLWGDDDADTLLLMNDGYQVGSGWHKDIPYFGYREGGHFLENAIERFKREDILGLDITVEYKN